MNLFINGGGSGEQNRIAYEKFSSMIDNSKPLLYVPLGMETEKFDECFEWITCELKPYNICNISMITSARELAKINLESYSAIFIGGGNTYKLLFELKLSGAFDKIKEFIESDGVVFGGSAGTIIFGEDIDSCMCDDSNDVGLVNTKGFNVLKGLSILAHYRNRDEEKNVENEIFLLQKSNDLKILALPEEDTLYVSDDIVEVIGTKPYAVFENGVKQSHI